MASLLLTAAIFTVLGLHLAAAVVTALALAPLARLAQAGLVESVATVFCLALLGAVTGFLVGLSHTPVVGAIVPAVLTLVTALVLIVVGREASAAVRVLTAAGASALMLNLLLGTMWGSRIREAPDAVSTPSENAEYLRESVCDLRYKYELKVRQQRQSDHIADSNPSLLVPGCTPPFGTDTYEPTGN